MRAESGEEVPKSAKPRRTWLGWAWWTLKAFAAAITLFLILFIVPSIDLVWHILFGWVYFLADAVPRLEVRWEAILSAILVLMMAMVFLDRIGRRFIPRWSMRSTVAVTAVVVALFASAISGTGIGHQMSWLGRGNVYGRDRTRLLTTRALLGQIAGDCRWLAEENSGYLPESLDEIEMSGFHYSVSTGAKSWWGPENEGIIYLGKGLKTDMPPHLPLVVTPRPFPESGQYLICRFDGTTDKLDPVAFRKLMDEWRSEMSKRTRQEMPNK